VYLLFGQSSHDTLEPNFLEGIVKIWLYILPNKIDDGAQSPDLVEYTACGISANQSDPTAPLHLEVHPQSILEAGLI
jgi:hypothetical protein